MNHFTVKDFPSLGESVSQKIFTDSSRKENHRGGDSQENSLQEDKEFQCLMCNKKGLAGSDIQFKDRHHIRFMFGKGLCVDCSSSTPEKEILYRYIGCDWIDSKGEKEKKLEEWMLRGNPSSRKKEVIEITRWVNMEPSRWPCDYPEQIKVADLYEERWESLAYYAVWIQEERVPGEKVSWYSRTHKQMMDGEVNNIKGLDKCSVFRKPETEEEKKTGNFYTKEIEMWKLFPPISQKDALLSMRKTLGGCRPGNDSTPFQCCGPCGRVRISLRSKHDPKWSGPNKSPYGGLFCKDCYDSENIHEKDWNMQRARQYYSDREHRGFGGVYVDNWSGKPGRTFRTCSCYKCSCPSPGNPHLKREYVCEDCGKKGNGCQGWFDRRSATGGLYSPWDDQDHWFCKECWIRDYWVKGEWENKMDGSVWFKSL